MRPLHALAPVAEATSSAALASHCAAAALQLLRGFGPHGARLMPAEGAVLALSLKTGAAVLTMMDLASPEAAGRVLAVLALRTALKQAFAAERRWLLRRPPGRA